MLLARDPLVLDHEAHQPGLHQAPHEQIVAPLRKCIAGIPLGTGRRDHRVPVIDRLLKFPGCGLRAGDRIPGVLDAVGLLRPPVIHPFLDQVQLVAAPGSVLHDPEPPLGIEGGGLHVAVAERPDLRLRVLPIDEGIVIRHGAIGLDAEDLAQMAVEALCVLPHRPVGALPHSNEEVAIGAEGEPRTEMQRAVVRGKCTEDHAHVPETLPIGRKRSAGDRGSVAVLAWLGVAPEDGPIRFEGRAERHVEQPSLPARVDLGQPANRLAQLTVGRDHPHAPRPLRHQ